MDDDGQGALAAGLLRRDAHALRNAVATIRSVVQLTDDVEVREALAAAASRLQVSVERAVAAARLDTGATGERADVLLGTVVELAARRAAREGGAPTAARWAEVHAEVQVVGPLLERLLADLLHCGGGGATGAEVRDGVVVLTTDLPPDDSTAGLGGYLHALARASGCSLELTARDARLDVPRSSTREPSGA